MSYFATINKIAKWLIFTAIVALLPLISAFLSLNTRESGKESSQLLIDILKRGELYLVAAAISAEAVGDLVSGRKTEQQAIQFLRLICGGSCVIIIILSTTLFTDLTMTTKDIAAIPQEMATTNGKYSLVMFVSAVVAGLGCKILEE